MEGAVKAEGHTLAIEVDRPEAIFAKAFPKCRVRTNHVADRANPGPTLSQITPMTKAINIAEVVLGAALILGIATRYAALASFVWVGAGSNAIAHRYWTYPAAQRLASITTG
jgi:uncharacterized membrane protein YphA (DoxX/SURF4 family)